MFGGLSYHKADRTPTELINAVLTTPGLDGIDLHGDERRQSSAHFAQVNAFTAAHMPPADRDAILAEIDALTKAAPLSVHSHPPSGD